MEALYITHKSLRPSILERNVGLAGKTCGSGGSAWHWSARLIGRAMNTASSIRSSQLLLPGFWRCLLMCVVGLITVLPANAQFNIYHPFPDSNAVWGMTAGCTDWNCGTYQYVQDYMAGDTVIDGNTYKVIGQSVSIVYGSCSCGFPPGDLGEGFLREDTAARKVYWRFPGSTVDTLLYDFTLELGDTLHGLYGNTGLCSEAIFTVQSIDSILVGGSYRKRINFLPDPSSPPSIIEGVGSTTGLTTCYSIPASYGIRLECFTVGDSLIYSSPFAPDLLACGNLPTGIRDETGFTGRKIAFQPNPTSGIVKLVCHFNLPPLDLLIYDVTGKAVFRSRITQEQSLIDLTIGERHIHGTFVPRRCVDPI